MRHILLILTIIISLPAFAAEPKTIYWEELLPSGELERLDELYASQSSFLLGHSEFDEPMMGAMPSQIGTFNTVDELDGELVRIPGFVLPFEYTESGKITEFLLVPYFGACIHTPPPPPNQIVYVTAKKPADLGRQWNAIWAVGILRTQKHLNNLGNAAYTLEIKSWEEYDE